MALTYKVLGQSNPSATTNTTIYTVPASTSAVVSTIVITALSTSTTFRLAVVKSGESIGNKNYLLYDAPISQYDCVSLTLGITLATGDYIVVYAGTANLSFNVFGSEIV